MEAAQHVVQHAEARLAQQAVARQATLGVHRLRHAGLGGHRDVALEHAAVELILGVAPHEVGAHRADQLLQPPHTRPFAHRVRQRGALGREVGRDDVVHVAAVVHHEHHGRVLGDGVQARVVGVADAHAVQRLRDAPRQPVADAEVHVGIEGRHDLARIALHLVQRHLARHAARNRAKACAACCTLSSKINRSISAWRRTCWNGRIWIARRWRTSRSTRSARLFTHHRAVGISSRSSSAQAASTATASASHSGTVMLVLMRWVSPRRANVAQAHA